MVVVREGVGGHSLQPAPRRRSINFVNKCITVIFIWLSRPQLHSAESKLGEKRDLPERKWGRWCGGGGVYSNLCKHMVASLLSSRILIKFQTGLRGMCVCLLMCMHVWRWRDLLYLPSRSGVRACARHHLILPPIQGDRAG